MTLGYTTTVFDTAFDAIFFVQAVLCDMYFLLFNVFLIILRAELSHIGHRLQLAAYRPRQLVTLFRAYFELIQLIALLTESFANPVLFSLAMLFYEGAFQLFQLYFLVFNRPSTTATANNAVDISSYALWLAPFAAKLVLTVNNASAVPEAVSWNS